MRRSPTHSDATVTPALPRRTPVAGPASAWLALRGSRFSLAFATLVMTTIAGCQTARVAEPLTASLGADEPDARMEFWHALSEQPVTSNDDAFHALLLSFDGGDPAPDYAARVARLKARGMLPQGFDGAADAAVDRGNLAVALSRVLGIKGGLTMRLAGGNSPRYAVRALRHRGLYPESSPNQTFSGAEFVGVMGRVEDYQRGDAATDQPAAAPLPSEVARLAPPSDFGPATPLFMAMQRPGGGGGSAAPPASQPAGDAPARPKATAEDPAQLTVVVTGVEGDVQVRAKRGEKWQPAKVNMRLTGTAEFRTGARSAVRFTIPPDQTYTLDRLGSTKVVQAIYDGSKVKTDVGLEKGRLRYDLVRGAAANPEPSDDDAELALEIEEAGVEYDSTIRSPNAALAVRGTLVSLYDQPPFAPEAISLTGRAVFQNTRRQLVAFGGQAKAAVRGQQTSAAEQAFEVATLDPNSPVTQNDFDTRQESLVIQRGGFSRGDVLVGDSGVTDADLLNPALGLLPGELNFVLRWDGGPERKLADLNLAVISPLSTAGAPDFVANPPFTVSLTPGEPQAEALRSQKYPRTSRSGGRIGRNHVGPEGLEIASWGADYPVGTYRVAAFNLVDAVEPPSEVVDPIDFTVAVFLSGQKLVESREMTIGTLQVSDPVLVRVPERGTTSAAATASAAPAKAAKARAARLNAPKAPRVGRPGGGRGR
jgi:hypothetical protein